MTRFGNNGRVARQWQRGASLGYTGRCERGASLGYIGRCAYRSAAGSGHLGRNGRLLDVLSRRATGRGTDGGAVGERRSTRRCGRWWGGANALRRLVLVAAHRVDLRVQRQEAREAQRQSAQLAPQLTRRGCRSEQ